MLGDSTMNSDETTRTSPTLLRRAADWRDHDAWSEFVARYEPYIQCWCREYRLDDLADDVCQRFWIDMADKMRSFRYDPGRRFRGWLRRCFHWRVVDALRERGREEQWFRSLDDPSLADPANPRLMARSFDDEDDDEPTPRRLLLLELANEVQAAVRGRVQAQSWQVFWHIAIDGWSTRETADALGISYLAAHAAHRRVGDRLAEEGRRRLGEWTNG